MSTPGVLVHPTMAGLTQHIARTQAFCRLISRRANVRIRMARAGTDSMTDALEDFGTELADIEGQIRRMQSDTTYLPLEDPMESHATCDRQQDRLRTHNIKLKRVNDGLWAQNAKLTSDIRRLKPTRHPVERPLRGRPTGQRESVHTLRGQLEALLGMQVGIMSTGTQVYLSRPALQQVVSLLRVATECRSYHEPNPPLAVS